MLEWSYENVQEHRRKLREHRSQIARKCVESWLEQLISPYIESAAPLPNFFAGYMSLPEDLPDATREVVVMAAKLGWNMLVCPKVRVEIWPDDKHPHENSGSEWDIIAVRARKQIADTNHRLAGAAQVVRSTLSGVIGSPDEMPSHIIVRNFKYDVLDRYRGQLAELGWQPVRTSCGDLFLTKLTSSGL